MKTRDFKGGTLGLVAVVTLAIAILGFAFFFFGKFLGGNRELQMAADAGAINTAKQAAVGVRVDINNLGFGLPPAPAFAGLGDPPNTNQVNLANYNRCVGKALLVALNAQSEGTETAGNSAREVFRQLQNVGTALQRRLAAGGLVNSYFRDLAGVNNIRLVAVGGQTQLIGNVTTAFMRPGGRANISFRFEPNQPVSDQDRQLQIENTLPPGITMASIAPFESDSSIRSTQNRRAYLRGYTQFVIRVPGGGVSLACVPNFPDDRPHNVSGADFNRARTIAEPIAYSPPNAFGADAQAGEARTALFERVLSHAIVGVLGNASTVSIPRGYIRLRNGPDLTDELASAGCAEDFSNSIFNNELGVAGPGAGAGIVRSNNGAFATVNSGGARLIGLFVAYNQSQGRVQPPRVPDGLNRDPNFDPFGPGRTPELFRQNREMPIAPVRWAGNEGRPAVLQSLLEASFLEYGGRACTVYNLADAPCTGEYLDSREPNIVVYARNYQRGTTSNPRGIDRRFGASRANQVKCRVIALGRQYLPNTTGGMVSVCVDVNENGRPPSGIKVFDKDAPHRYRDATRYPGDRVNFGEPSTPLRYLFFAGSCSLRNESLPYEFSPDTIAGQIAQRCLEAFPGVTTAQVRRVLDSRVLNLGSTLYLFRRDNQLVLEPNLPLEWGINDAENAPDGRPQTCASTYPLGPNFVNTRAEGDPARPTIMGDADTHIAPFMSEPTQNIQSTDSVMWTPSTGGSLRDISGRPVGGNLLGDCLFLNNASGTARFCNIN